MSCNPPTEGGARSGVLAARQAIAEARHPRVPEPTAGLVLAGLGRRRFVAAEVAAGDALQIMAEDDSDAVAVLSSGGRVGVFSARDFARLGPASAADTPLADVTCRDVAVVAPQEDLRQCLALLNERREIHLAVVDQGRLLGLLSRCDLLAARVAYLEAVCHETEMDQKLLFLRGVYSC